MSSAVPGLQTSCNDSHESDGGFCEVYDDVPAVMGMGEGCAGFSEHQPSLAPVGAPMSSNGSPGSCESKREPTVDQTREVVTPRQTHVGGSSESSAGTGADEDAKGSGEGIGEAAPQTPASGPKSIKDITISWLGGKKAKSPSKRSPAKAAAASAGAGSAALMSESSEEEGSDGPDDRDEVESMTQLLLDPVKTRQAVTSGIYAGEQVTINPQVREALNLIIASPSPKVSTLIRQHRRLERMGNGKAPSLAFSPARTHTYSNGQRNRWGSAADRAALAQFEVHSRISKSMAVRANQSEMDKSKWEGTAMGESAGPTIDGLQDSPGSRAASLSPSPLQHQANTPPPQHKANTPPPQHKANTPPPLSGLQADFGDGASHNLSGLQDSSFADAPTSHGLPSTPLALDAPTSHGLPSTPLALDAPTSHGLPSAPLALDDFQADGLDSPQTDDEHIVDSPSVNEERNQEQAEEQVPVPDPPTKLLRYRALEHLDLVESLVDQLEGVIERAEVHDSRTIAQGGAERLAPALSALRFVQLAVISDAFEAARDGISQCEAIFSDKAYTDAENELRVFRGRLAEAEERARVQSIELEHLDEENRRMFEAVRGNDALQKAGFCLADERYDLALGFIDRAEKAFLRSGAGEQGQEQDGMLAFLRDMARRVTASKKEAQAKAKVSVRSGAALIVQARGDAELPAQSPNQAREEKDSQPGTVDHVGSQVSNLGLEDAMQSKHAIPQVQYVAADVKGSGTWGMVPENDTQHRSVFDDQDADINAVGGMVGPAMMVPAASSRFSRR